MAEFLSPVRCEVAVMPRRSLARRGIVVNAVCRCPPKVQMFKAPVPEASRDRAGSGAQNGQDLCESLTHKSVTVFA